MISAIPHDPAATRLQAVGSRPSGVPAHLPPRLVCRADGRELLPVLPAGFDPERAPVRRLAADARRAVPEARWPDSAGFVRRTGSMLFGRARGTSTIGQPS